MNYEIYSTVGVDQTHSDDPVNYSGGSHDGIRVNNEEVREIWIRRAKGRVSSTTTKFVYSCILRGNTANHRATVSFLPVKSKPIVPRKSDFMKVPDLSKFIKKDQNVQEDSSQFDFSTVELKEEVSRDEWHLGIDNSSTGSQKIVKVPFSRSNSTEEIRRTDMNQSESRTDSRPALTPSDQSESGARVTSDQSETGRAQLDGYKRSSSLKFDITAISETEGDTSATETLHSTSNSIDFLEDCARPPSSNFLRKATSNLLWLVQNSRRILKRRTRPRKHQRYRLLHAIYEVISLCSKPIIAFICCDIMGLSGTAPLRLLQALRLGLARRYEDVEPDSDD